MFQFPDTVGRWVSDLFCQLRQAQVIKPAQLSQPFAVQHDALSCRCNFTINITDPSRPYTHLAEKKMVLGIKPRRSIKIITGICYAFEQSLLAIVGYRRRLTWKTPASVLACADGWKTRLVAKAGPSCCRFFDLSSFCDFLRSLPTLVDKIDHVSAFYPLAAKTH